MSKLNYNNVIDILLSTDTSETKVSKLLELDVIKSPPTIPFAGGFDMYQFWCSVSILHLEPLESQLILIDHLITTLNTLTTQQVEALRSGDV